MFTVRRYFSVAVFGGADPVHALQLGECNFACGAMVKLSKCEVLKMTQSNGELLLYGK